MDLKAGTETGYEGSLCTDLLLDSSHLRASAAVLGGCFVVLASPKHWFLHCNLAAPSPVASSGLSSGPVTLPHGGITSLYDSVSPGHGTAAEAELFQ